MMLIGNYVVFSLERQNQVHTIFRWQARREGDRNMRAGLIPSRALQERRIIHERTQGEKDEEGN